MSTNETIKLLHLYAQADWHDPAFIVGNRPALLALKAAIERALSDEEGIGKADAFTADGEGYSLYVALNESEQLSSLDWQGLRLPYTDPIAKEDAALFGPEALVYLACDVCGAPVCPDHHAQHAQGCAKCRAIQSPDAD